MPRPTKLPDVSKDREVKALVAELGGRTFRRQGATWMRLDNGHTTQLTYEWEMIDGQQVTITDHKAMALRLLGQMRDARAALGTVEERWATAVRGVRDEILPNYRPHCFCHWKHQSGDKATVFHSFGGWFVRISLLGENEGKFEGRDLDALIDAAEKHGRPPLTDEEST
jgi:hypothetical protein